jgi:hypothetical protein
MGRNIVEFEKIYTGRAISWWVFSLCFAFVQNCETYPPAREKETKNKI